MIRSTFGRDRYVVGEDDAVFGTRFSWTGNQPDGIVFCHGAMDTASTAVNKTAQRHVMTAVARHFTVHVGDLEGSTFGNDTGLTRVEEAVAYLRAEWGQEGPVVLVGISMGFITACVYTLNHPDEVAAIAGIIPGIDLASLHGIGGATATLIDAAYPPAYDDGTDGPTHSPIQFVGDLPPDLPIHLFTASDDTMALPATATAFVTARPKTGRTDLGALGHTEAAIEAAVDDVAEFVAQFTS